MHLSSCKYLVLLVTSLCLLFLSCSVNDSTNPYSPSNTTIGIVLQSLRLQPLTGKSFSDTSGDTISIGAIAYLSDNIDSTRITVISSASDTDTSFQLRFYKSPRSFDTAWGMYIPHDTATINIKVTAYIRNGIIITDSAKVIVFPKSAPIVIDTATPQMRLLLPLKDSSLTATGSLIMQIICTDESGIASLVCTTGVYRFSPVKSATADSVWSTNITGLIPGKYNAVSFIAIDSSTNANKDTLTVHIKYDGDSIAPVMRLVAPAKDSASVNANSYAVKLVCRDPSGISSLVCSMNGSMITLTHNPGDSIWQANIIGLVSEQYNKITFIAIDSSLSANRDTLSVYIKYDPNMEDSDGPTFFHVNGPVTGEVIKDSIVSITDSITDPNGVDSVYWALNGTKAGMLSVGTNNKYSLKDTLNRFHLDTIVIYSQDKSARRNKSSSMIVLDYNLPPVINDTAVSAQKNIVLSWTMHAISADNDPLTWSIVSSPSSASGAMTGTLPSITFSPITNWSGIDSMLVRVSDGKWADTAKVRITMFDVPVAPKNVKIVLQPAPDTIVAGKSLVFSVSMNPDVNPAPSYQWYYNGTAITGATASTYPLGSVALKDAGAYSVTVTNGLGSATSPAVILVVLLPPSISIQPVAQTKCTGEGASFTVEASGTIPLSYKWKKNGTAIPVNSDEATFSIASISASDSGLYSCQVTNGAGNVSTQSAKLTVKIPPAISSQPSALTKCINQTASFTVAASGTAPLIYTWKKNGIQIPGAADAATYTINSVSESDSGLYSCAITNGCVAGVTSQSARLTVNLPPTITQQPVSQTKWAGDSVSFTVKATGSGTLSYQWKKGNTNISGAISDTYKISHIFYSTDHDAAFSCVVINGCGNGVTSNPATLTVNAVKAVAAGWAHSLILRTDGTLWACGWNTSGQLGDNTIVDRHTPIQIMNDVSSVSAGNYYSLLIKTDGTLWAWGSNSNGELGDGTTEERHSPKQIMSGVSKSAAGITGSQTILLKINGELWGYGDNFHGQLGVGDSINRSSPAFIMTGVSNIYTNSTISLFLKPDNSLWGCGTIGRLFLGDSITEDRRAPVNIMSGISKIAIGGGGHFIILKTDNTMWACGFNGMGQLGNGSTEYNYSPIQVTTGVSDITAGHFHSLILKIDGKLYACGLNNNGQLGDDDLTPKSITFVIGVSCV